MSQANLTQETINEFVVSSHFDLPKVEAMLAENPALLNENADWIETPIQAASHVGRFDIIEFLLSKGAPLDICTAAVLEREADVRQFLADDPNLKHATGAHDIPLMFFAAISGNVAIAQILLDAGAALNVEDGITSPLHGAAIFGKAEMARWLLDNDANPYGIDSSGKTAFDHALGGDNVVIIELLRPFFPDQV